MKLKLDFAIPESNVKINLGDPVMLVGSCFSDNIGKLLLENKFTVVSNPFGTIYNPYSIFKVLSARSDNTIENQGVHYHWDAHSAISGLTREEAITAFENQLASSKEFLKQAKWLVITFGTAWVYRYRASGEIVANCHKVPATQFEKELLDVGFIKSQFFQFQKFLSSINPDLKIILTISPVRHIRDGLIENNRSKAVLIESTHQILDEMPEISYFPSYEIMIDELRDYRFFASDMIHPSAEAILYLWDRFANTYFDKETTAFLGEWKKIQSALSHKPFLPHSPLHENFLKQTLTKLEKLSYTVDLRIEIEELEHRIRSLDY